MLKLKYALFVSLLLSILSAEQERVPLDKYKKLNPWTESYLYDPNPRITNFTVTMAMYYGWFGSYAYCYDDEITEGHCCEGKFEASNWTLFDHGTSKITYKNEDFESNYVVFKSEVYKKYVIAFPGTRGGFQQILDEVLNAILEPLDDPDNPIWIMDYTTMWFDKVEKKLFSDKNLAEFRANPDYQFLWIGHSLGGSTAALAAFHEAYYPEYSFNKKYKSVLLTYGQNRLGNGDFVDFMEPKMDIYRVLRRYDVVGLIPPCTLDFLTADHCEKLHDVHVHAGKYYLIDEIQEFIYHCDVEYVQPTDPKCVNLLDYSDFDFLHHTQYLGHESFSGRCKSNYVEGEEKEEEKVKYIIS